MDRRTLLAAGAAIAVAGLTGEPARAATRRPIFEWARPGGFFPGEGFLTPPALAVYDDGTAYADAAATLPLRPAQVERLLTQAADVLGDPRNTRRDPGRPARDRPVDHVSLRGDDGAHLTAELPGWGDGDSAHAFPEALRALDRHVQDLRRTVLAGGEPWRPNAILLATVRLDHRPDAADPWPAGLPRPDLSALYAERVVRGEQAQAVRRTLPPGSALWPAYRMSPLAFARAGWRHLLPHEIEPAAGE
ncbi:hypothetical protein [Actinoplanes sp. M2I2]|uniref:hypothetical protein n=1 Tax=Actinoplanes sp. M2I2 TaxID=1734444 RepID=UPI002021CBFA|nr:hypothetical protein [Actinoplanes sp. M2I2]